MSLLSVILTYTENHLPMDSQPSPIHHPMTSVVTPAGVLEEALYQPTWDPSLALKVKCPGKLHPDKLRGWVTPNPSQFLLATS